MTTKCRLMYCVPWIMLVISLLTCPPLQAQIQVFTDETSYLSALAAMEYTTLLEDFDSNDWDSVRYIPASSVTSKGITWTASDQVTTSEGPAVTGWSIYDQPGGDPDILFGESTQALYGIGGWFKTSTPLTSIQIYLDGVIVSDAHVTIGTEHSFLGVVAPDGFTAFEIRDTDATPEDQKHWFGDNFTFGVMQAQQAPSMGVTGILVLAIAILLTGLLFLRPGEGCKQTL